MKVLLSALVLLMGASAVSAEPCPLPNSYFVDVYRSDYCSFDDLLEQFELYYNSTIDSMPNCGTGATGGELEQLLIAVIGASTRETAQTALLELCQTAHEAYLGTVTSIPFKDIAGYGDDFVQLFFNGATTWNEEVATLYPPFDGDNDGRGKESNILRRDAAKVNRFFNDDGQHGIVDWPPDSIPNFQSCEANAVYCCWTQDRQANDNNGNCAKPYDVKCVDKDPGDNTNLCYVDMSNSADVIGHSSFDGSFYFPLDDGNNGLKAEGPIHCHGLAWADSTADPSFLYRANNLFYVSMFDHMHQRGYVRNVQGAPMCGCSEQMPIVSRSDCTQIDPVLTYKFIASGDTVSIMIKDVEIDFNACEGLDRYGDNDNNDLWSYAHRMFLEDKYSAKKLELLTERLVGDDPDNCRVAMKKGHVSNGMVRGYNADLNVWKIVAGREAMQYQSDMGPQVFRDYLMATPNKVIRRICPGCRYPFRNIYVKYIGEKVEGLHILDNLKFFRSKTPATGMVYKTDFEIYSSMEDLVSGVNEWNCTEYNYRNAFPGDCNPSGGKTTGQQSIFNVLNNQQADVAYYVEAISPSPLNTVAVTSIGDKPFTGAINKVGDKTIMSGFGQIGYQGAADFFDFYNTYYGGDVTLEAELESLDAQGARFGMSGLMIRSGLEAKAPMFGIWLYWDSGTTYKLQTFIRKTATSNRWNGNTKTITELPIWLRVEKRIQVYTSFYKTSADADWTILGSYTLTGLEESEIYAGMFTASYSNWRATEAVYVGYESEAHFFPSAAPSVSEAPTYKGEESFDIGVGDFENYPGSTTYSDGAWLVKATGRDIWDRQDGFRLSLVESYPATLDFYIEASVEALSYPYEWAKVGVMIRDAEGFAAQDGEEKNAFMSFAGNKGALMCCRTSTRGTTTVPDKEVVTENKMTNGWVRLEKKGTTYTGYKKLLEEDEWIKVGVCDIDMGTYEGLTGRLRIGLAATSHEMDKYITVEFTNVEVGFM